MQLLLISATAPMSGSGIDLGYSLMLKVLLVKVLITEGTNSQVC